LPTREVPRERVLSDDELRLLWLASEAIGGTAGAYVRLLMLTGARRSEIARLRWSEVDGDLLTLPATRMKGRTTHIIPLSTQAAAILNSMSRQVGAPQKDGFVFGSPISQFGPIKRELDARMGDTQHWTFHDTRRATATGMAKLGIAIPVIERLLAHKSGTFRGVVAVYQRHSFLPEMMVAVQKWADHLDQLVGRKPAKVLKMPRR
jgi:integrase